MINLLNSPLDYVTKAINELYPNITINVFFDLWEENDGCVCSIDGEDNLFISVNVDLQFINVIEVVVRESARIIAGLDSDIEVWQETYNKISEKVKEISVQDMAKLSIYQ
jgi:hypothetical protein